ncbi:MAG: PulJ/GspJ family protein, partial [Acidobacteriota bacterium]
MLKNLSSFISHLSSPEGHLLVELMLAIGISAIILPALLTGLVASREGRPQQEQRAQATALLKETAAAVRNVRDNDWNAFASNGTYYPQIANNVWTLVAGTPSPVNGLTRTVALSDVYRDSGGKIVPTGGTLDPSTKQAEITISWTQPSSGSIKSTLFLTRTTNLT